MGKKGRPLCIFAGIRARPTFGRISLPMRSAGPRQGQVSREDQSLAVQSSGRVRAWPQLTRALNCTLNLATRVWRPHWVEGAPKAKKFLWMNGRHRLPPCQNAHNILVLSGGAQRWGESRRRGGGSPVAPAGKGSFLYRKEHRSTQLFLPKTEPRPTFYPRGFPGRGMRAPFSHRPGSDFFCSQLLPFLPQILRCSQIHRVATDVKREWG